MSREESLEFGEGPPEEQQCGRRLAGLADSDSESASHVSIYIDQENPNSLAASDTDEERKRKEKQNRKTNEKDLLKTIKEGNFENIKNTITPRALANCYSDSLLMGMKVSFQLRRLADNKGPDEGRFNQLANSVEEFTYCLLDPLKSNQDFREHFGEYYLDFIMEDAIEFSKKLFTHPVINDEMNRKWYGRNSVISPWTTRWYLKLLLSIWCIFDLVFSPILFSVCTMLKKRSKRSERSRVVNEDEDESHEKSHVTVAERYLIYLETPYFKFVRDTLSYTVLVVLHYALCLSPSTIAFSGLEWAILIFFVGRYLVERKQICDILQRIKPRRKKGDDDARAQSNIWFRLKTLSIYLSDRWNRLDFLCLLVYLVILTLRVATPIVSGLARNNRALAIASYLYGFNALCLTFRIFGQVMEQSKEMGIIQIALFSILKNISAIIWQFMAAILAFSIAITKVYMAEESFLANGSDGNDNACKKSGISCWWAMITQLAWSLLGESKEFDHVTPEDLPSKTLARIFYAGFLIMGIILLINLLIALLTNTYQRVEDNSTFEWSFKRLVTCQTYDAYDPIPVPMNIIYSIVKLLNKLVGRKDEGRKYKRSKDEEMKLNAIIEDLETRYFEMHGNSFPLTGEDKVEGKVDRVLHETEILSTTFKFQSSGQGALYRGQKAWADVAEGIRIDGLLLTCEDKETWRGARHRQSFSAEFPYFEVAILETGEKRFLAVGVVNKGYSTDEMPGWSIYDPSVGYHTDDGMIIQDNNERETKGPAMARRGDRIRCTVMFEDKRDEDGKVPVVFTLNGKEIIMKDGEYQIFMDADTPWYPYICMIGGYSVLVKMCLTEDLDSKVTQSIKRTNRKIDTLLTRMTDMKEQYELSIARFAERDKEAEERWKNMEATNQKLDTLLAILTDHDIKKDPPKI